MSDRPGPPAVRVLIVDDEPLARRGLRGQLGRHAAVEIVGEATNGEDAVRALVEQRPDLVFLDIQMPGLDGFEVLQAIPQEIHPAVVFVTAFDEFALRAFDAGAADYLLKPFDDDRFDVALERALLHAGRNRARLPDLLAHVSAEGRYPRRLAAHCGGRLSIVDVLEIDWAESARNYVLLHTEGEEHLMRSTLTGLLTKLDPERFIRIHRSYVVSLDAIRRVQRHLGGDTSVRLRDGTDLPVGRSYRRLLGQRFGERRGGA